MKIVFVSLGCDKNLADTELMLGILREKGYEFVKVSVLINAVPIYRFKLKKMQRNR